MAKMNLSVIMQTIDKTSAVVKKITSSQSKYAKQLSQVRDQSKKISDNQSLITNFRKTGVEAGKNKEKLNAAQQKLTQLNQKMSASKKPSASLQNQFKKQQLAVKNLSANQNEYTKALTKTQNKMKTAGINVKRLSSEEKRLSKEYDKRVNQMDKLATKEQRLQKIRSKLGKFKLPKIGGAALAKGGALLSGLSFAGLFTQLNSSAAEMDKLSKSAQNLNMPVEELQAMQSQAKHAGVEADTMTNAMGRFTKRLGVLQTTGTGAMGSFLKKGKNPLYEELKGAKDTQQAYEKVLDSFSKLKTNQEQMAFADAAFGQDGRKMLVMLRAGTDGLTKSRKEFNEIGGGVKTEDAKKAEAYNDAMQKVQESIKSIKFAALAPIMEKMTKVFTAFSNKFKNAKWREGVIRKVTNTVTSLYNGFKLLGKGFLWATEKLPEIIAGFALLKIGVFALNAAMLSNPIGLVVAAIAALVVGIGYLIVKAGGLKAVWNNFTAALSNSWQKIKEGVNLLLNFLMPSLGGMGGIVEKVKSIWNGFTDSIRSGLGSFKDIVALIADFVTPSIDGMGGTFDRVKAGLVAGIALIKSHFLLLPRAIMKALSLIPNKLLPDGWGENIKKAQQQLEQMNSGVIDDVKSNIEYAVTGNADPVLNTQNNNDILRHPSIQSKSEVEVRIKSDKPVEITQAKSDKNTDVMIDTGDLLGAAF